MSSPVPPVPAWAASIAASTAGGPASSLASPPRLLRAARSCWYRLSVLLPPCHVTPPGSPGVAAKIAWACSFVRPSTAITVGAPFGFWYQPLVYVQMVGGGVQLTVTFALSD